MKITKYPERILVYEALGFLAIVAMSMLDEIYEIPKRYFVAYTGQPEMWEGSFETVMILLVAVAILLATNRLVKRLFYLEGFLRVCAWCRNIHRDGEWISLENYFASGFDTKTTHGMCPDCFAKMQRGEYTGPVIVPPPEDPAGRQAAGTAPPAVARVPAPPAAPR